MLVYQRVSTSIHPISDRCTSKKSPHLALKQHSVTMAAWSRMAFSTLIWCGQKRCHFQPGLSWCHGFIVVEDAPNGERWDDVHDTYPRNMRVWIRVYDFQTTPDLYEKPDCPCHWFSPKIAHHVEPNEVRYCGIVQVLQSWFYNVLPIL